MTNNSRSPRERVMASMTPWRKMESTAWFVKSMEQISMPLVANCVPIRWRETGRKPLLNKFNRNKGLIEQGQLTNKGRQLLLGGSFFYFVLLCLMCFLPNAWTRNGTPGIQHFGRVVVLLVPFNSLINLAQVTSLVQLIKVFVQNIANIFLLFLWSFSCFGSALARHSETRPLL